jgi:hypothetical protein
MKFGLMAIPKGGINLAKQKQNGLCNIKSLSNQHSFAVPS